jgi:hypothetical protein
MPYGSEHFSVKVPFDAAPGEVCYELVAQVFERFGFDRDDVPYSRLEDGQHMIDEVSLFSRASTQTHARLPAYLNTTVAILG